MAAEPVDWKFLGRYLRAARAGRPRHVIEEESGVSESQIKRYEYGEVKGTEPPDQMWKLTVYYGWPTEKVLDLLHGPPPRPPTADSPLPQAIAHRVAALLETDPDLPERDKEAALAWLANRTAQPSGE